ncbi:MAG: short-chain dehydrogenase [Coxiella sp. (in: Bacteria)]|nr:MAG: short-chain dehydrogenase [Coxiella sp. (in: g-proteobacteria)]
MNPKPHVVCITGASSGIGAALAKAYAAPHTHLLLIGRSEQRLKQVADICIAAGATAVVASIDVTDKRMLQAWIREQDQQTPIDLLIANAGLSMSQAQNAGLDTEAAEAHLIDVHLQGTLNTIYAVRRQMQTRQCGQIAIMSSLNGFIVLGRSRIYGAVKAALLSYGLSLRSSMQKYNIKVSVICPGWVQSALTDLNKFSMPFKLTADQAAVKIKAGLCKNKSIIAFPRLFYMLLLCAIRLPLFIRNMITKNS